MPYRQRTLRSLGNYTITLWILLLIIPFYNAEELKTDDHEQQPNDLFSDLSIEGKINDLENDWDLESLDNLITSISGRSADSLKDILLHYIDETLTKKSHEIISGLKIDLNNQNISKYLMKEFSPIESRISKNDSIQDELSDQLQQFTETHVLNMNIPRAVESTGRLFFFKGLKKIMWPVFIGMQVVKTILLAMFLPSIIGSLGKIVGKGLSSVSGFAHPSETVDDLDFKDQTQDTMGYTYMQGDGGNSNMKNNFANQMYDAAAANNAVSRFGMTEQKLYLPASTIDYSRNSNMHMGTMTGTNDDFKVFHDIPASSMLLTNYDPFYSPLLSRLDAVFQQLGLGNGDEKCREKLVCLMYASPAKYAPYSNLISAQLSRELDELRKPTSDNPDILRFFKYMKAAKDGQDHVDCDVNFKECTNLKDTESPAMITTFNDINKLVQARKLVK